MRGRPGSRRLRCPPVAIYFVRHAKAGSRQQWVGDDVVRPLSKAGRAQAEGLVGLLGGQAVPRIASSPYLRCVQTVEPLAAAVGLVVEPLDMLAEGRPFEPVLELLVALAEESVLCSHGDVIPDTIEALMRRGMVVEGEPDWRKGATWVLERVDGDVVRAKALPPPV
jgi:8-oxo-dGTP diphosphatase